MKTLIIYYSHTNNNRILAVHLQKQLRCDILEVEEFRRRTGLTILLDLLFNRTPSIKFSPRPVSGYDMIILAAPIWAGKVAGPMRAFLQQEKSAIKRYAFITLCGGATGDQVQKIREGLNDIAGLAPEAICQLSINDLLSPDRRDKVKYTSAYRVNGNDLSIFNARISQFINQLENVASVFPR